jgi:hypothetical protein
MNGYSNNPSGRPKGSPNKSTKETRAALMKVVEGELEQLTERLRAADTRTYFDILLKIMPFILPKLGEEQPEADVKETIGSLFSKRLAESKLQEIEDKEMLERRKNSTCEEN